MKRSTIVNISAVSVLLISIAVVGALAVSGVFNNLDRDGFNLPWDSPDDNVPDDPSDPPPGTPGLSGEDDGASSPDGGSGTPGGDRQGGGGDDGSNDDPGNEGPVAPPSPSPVQPDRPNGDERDNKVKLGVVNHAYNAVVGSDAPQFDIMAYGEDGDAYSGEITLEVDISPSGGHATAPTPYAPNPELHQFNVRFDQPGVHKVKVTPYDHSGNAIGDAIEMSVNVVSAQDAVTEMHSHVDPGGDAAKFTSTVKVLQMDTKRQPVLEVSRIVVTVNGTDHESRLSYPNTGITMGIAEVPGPAVAPGEQYIVKAYSGDQVIATTTGTVPR